MTASAAFDPAKLGVPIDQWEVGLKISCSAISLSSFTLINLPLPFSVGVFSELNPSCKRGCAFSELNLSSDFLLFLSSGVHGNRHRGGTWRLAIRLRSRRERGGARQGAQARHLPRDRRRTRRRSLLRPGRCARGAARRGLQPRPGDGGAARERRRRRKGARPARGWLAATALGVRRR